MKLFDLFSENKVDDLLHSSNMRDLIWLCDLLNRFLLVMHCASLYFFWSVLLIFIENFEELLLLADFHHFPIVSTARDGFSSFKD